jgi:hypothetical protein
MRRFESSRRSQDLANKISRADEVSQPLSGLDIFPPVVRFPESQHLARLPVRQRRLVIAEFAGRPSQPVRRLETLPSVTSEMPANGGLLQIGGRSPDTTFGSFQDEIADSLRRLFEKLPFWETAAGDRVRSTLRGRACSLTRQILRRGRANWECRIRTPARRRHEQLTLNHRVPGSSPGATIQSPQTALSRVDAK